MAVLLRAVNVGGRRLTMAEFKTALAGLGFADAVTVAATGNAVVQGRMAAGLEARLERGLGEALGGVTDVFVRDGSQLSKIVADNPFEAMARSDPSHLLVVFLRGQPEAAAVKALQGKVAGPEIVAAGPGCLYACFPDGIGRSKLSGAMIERTLKLRGTGRNWNTVAKLGQLTA